MTRTFNDYPISESMKSILRQLNFEKPTEIQDAVLPHALEGRSVIGQSETGSGKTHAFLVPLFESVNTSKQEIQKIILTPTRELATQIFEAVKQMIAYRDQDDLNARLVIGGTDKNRELQKVKSQKPHIVVGTPGRLLDFMQEEAILSNAIDSVVIDEADLMIDLGLIEEIDQILYRLKENVQVMVFSATIPKGLQVLFKKYLNDPVQIEIEQGAGPEHLEHRLVPLRHRSQSDLIIEVSKLIHPYIALIFVNNKVNADELYEELLTKGLKAGILHGGLKPRERKRMLQAIQSLKFQYIVATDLAARGIDLPGVSHVFNAEFPTDQDAYRHRVGRTARAGAEGTAVSFYEEKNMPLIQKLEEQGITFNHMDVKNGEWVTVKSWDEREKRKKVNSSLDAEAWQQVRRRKKVKPGYKKKMREEKERVKRQIKRKRYR